MPPLLRAILAGQSGDYLLPPRDVSFLLHVALVCGYDKGAYYPRNHFFHFVDTIADVIRSRAAARSCSSTRSSASKSSEGGSLGLDEERPHVHRDALRLERRSEAHGEARRRRSLRARSPSPRVRVLVRHLHDVPRREGARSTRARLRIVQRLALPARRHQSHLRRPARPPRPLEPVALHVDAHAPLGRARALSARRTDPRDRDRRRSRALRAASQDDRRAYNREKKSIVETILDVVEGRYVPRLREHLTLRVAGTPATNERFCRAPEGNAYGAALTPANVRPGRGPYRSAVDNLWMVNATAGFPSVAGAVGAGVRLYEDLSA